jgi:RecB family endonuclease NucS
MINTAGAYILVLIFQSHNEGGITAIEMTNRESCEAAIEQLHREMILNLRAYCIAKDVTQ